MKRLIQLYVFFLPIQLAFHLWPNWSYIYGIRVDYLSFAIYFTDLISVGLIAYWLFNKFNFYNVVVKRKITTILLLELLFFLVNSIFSLIPQLVLIKMLKIVELTLVGLILVNEKDLDIRTWIIKPLYLSSALISIIGLLQFVYSSTLGGILYWLGERSFNIYTPGIAKINILGHEYLRVYSVFSHPNSLAGYLLVPIILLIYDLIENRKINLLISTLIITCFILTFSLSALISLAFAVFVILLIKINIRKINLKLNYLLLLFIVVSMLAPVVSKQYLMSSFFTNESTSVRLTLSENATKLFSTNPFIGVGLNNSITSTAPSSYLRNIWMFQPVHNIYLLLAVEAGLVGLVIYYLLISNALNKGESIYQVILITLCFVGMFDHYILTLQQNIMLFSIFLALSFRNLKT